MAEPQQYSLRWNNYLRQLTYALDNHRVNDEFVDVSLLCDGRKIKAHKVVLSSCSSYFKEIFTENPHPHPIIIFKFIKYEDLNSIVKFMYQGEVNVQQEGLQSFLQTAKLLAVHGLDAEDNTDPNLSNPYFSHNTPSKSATSSSRCTDVPKTINILPKSAPAGNITGMGFNQQPTLGHEQQTKSNTQPMTSTTTKTIQPSPGPSYSKKRKVTNSDEDNDNVCAAEAMGEQTLVEIDGQTSTDTLRMDIPEYILGAADDQLSQTAGALSERNISSEGCGPNISQIKSEYEILTDCEAEDKYQPLDETEMTIETRRLINPSTSSFIMPLEDTASCSNTGLPGNRSSSSVEDAPISTDNFTLLSALLEQNKKLLEDNKTMRQSLDTLRLSINNLDKNNEDEQKKNSHANEMMYTHLTEQFIHLRTNIESVLQSLKSISAASLVLNLSTPEEILEFDEKIKYDDNVKTQLIKKFEHHANDDVRKFVTESLQLIFKDDTIVSKFSWSTLNNNISVRDLNFVKILKDVTLEKLPQTTNSTVEANIKMFFNSAKDRLKKRNKRKTTDVA